MIQFVIRATPPAGAVRVHTGEFAGSIEAFNYGMDMLADVDGHGAVRIVRADTVSAAQREAMLS